VVKCQKNKPETGSPKKRKAIFLRKKSNGGKTKTPIFRKKRRDVIQEGWGGGGCDLFGRGHTKRGDGEGKNTHPKGDWHHSGKKKNLTRKVFR